MTEIEKRVIGEALWWDYYDDGPGCERRWVKYPITRITAKRVYYTDHGEETYCDRAQLEAKGYVRRRGILIYLDGPEEAERRREEQHRAWLDGKADEVKQLRQNAANAHPDRGGTDEEFRLAYARYERARGAVAR